MERTDPYIFFLKKGRVVHDHSAGKFSSGDCLQADILHRHARHLAIRWGMGIMTQRGEGESVLGGGESEMHQNRRKAHLKGFAMHRELLFNDK